MPSASSRLHWRLALQINPPSRTLSSSGNSNNVCTEHLPQVLQKHIPYRSPPPQKGEDLSAKFRYDVPPFITLDRDPYCIVVKRFILASFVGLLLGGISFGQTQYKVLVFSATAGFRHDSITNGIAA